jgi:alkyl hydroperoxide reductase subunit F
MPDDATEPRESYDVLVIGAGPAGLSAAMYCARQGWATAVVGGNIGGQAAWAGQIENYLGWQLITGAELVQRFRDHVSKFDVDCFEGQLVSSVVAGEDGAFDVFTQKGIQFHARAVIIATGRAPNRLAVPGERELIGHGVSYCATCDAPFFRGKPVVVVGPGESALDAALQLAKLEATVTVLSEAPPRAPQAVLDKVSSQPRITLRTGVKVAGITGIGRVDGVSIQDVGAAAEEEEVIPAEGVFIEMGSIPVADFAGGLVEVNAAGEVVVDNRGATSAPGIYAAGDVTDGLGKQVIIAAGEGARAAVAADRDLKRR